MIAGKEKIRKEKEMVLFHLVLLLHSCVLGEKGRRTCLIVKKQLKLFPAFTNFLQQRKAGVFGGVSYRPAQGIYAVQGPATLGGLLGQLFLLSLKYQRPIHQHDSLILISLLSRV